jgi:hypothetical protein
MIRLLSCPMYPCTRAVCVFITELYLKRGRLLCAHLAFTTCTRESKVTLLPAKVTLLPEAGNKVTFRKCGLPASGSKVTLLPVANSLCSLRGFAFWKVTLLPAFAPCLREQSHFAPCGFLCLLSRLVS